jgi:hypothetical protein
MARYYGAVSLSGMDIRFQFNTLTGKYAAQDE